MKIMKSYLRFFILVISLLVASCEQKHETYMNLRYVNNSNHTIDIEFSFIQTPAQLYPNITLKPGEIVRGYATIAGETPASAYNVAQIYEKATICYDGEYVIEHEYLDNKFSAHDNRNICLNKSYKITRGEQGYYYTYTFTDADYEYAVENGQRVTQAE